MKHSEVLSRYVNTGQRIPKKQFDRLSKSLQKSYLRMRGIAGYEGWEFKVLSDDDRIRFIEKKGKTLNDDSSEIIEILLQGSDNKDLIATKIIDTIGEKLYKHEVEYLLEYLLEYSKDIELIKKLISFGRQIKQIQYIKLSPSLQKYYMRIRGIVRYNDWELIYLTDDKRIKFIEKKGENLYFRDINDLLQYSEDKHLIATKIIESMGKELNPQVVSYLFKYSEDKNKNLIATKIIEVKGIKLDDYVVSYLLKYSNDKDLIATKIIDLKGEELTSHQINNLLQYSEDKHLIATKIIDLKGEKLSFEDVSYLLYEAKDKELIKKTLLQNGVDYKLINKVITNLKIDTPLIPDNYQEMLNEIRRIKEIMK
jgi:hypothetical protein